MYQYKEPWIIKIVPYLIAGTIIAIFILALIYGIKKSAQNQCDKWREDDANYPAFEWTEIIKQQCGDK